MKLNDLTKLYQKKVETYLKGAKVYIMLNGDTHFEPENKEIEEQQKKFREQVEKFIKNFGKEASDYIDKKIKEFIETHGGKRPSKQWEKEQRFSFVEERIAIPIETFKENFFKRFQYEPQKHHLLKYIDYGVKHLFFESWKEYHIKLSNKSKKKGHEQDNNGVINRYGYHEDNPPTRPINPFKQAQKIGNEKFRQRQLRQESNKSLVNPFRQAQQSVQDKTKQTKQDDTPVTEGTAALASVDKFKQEPKRTFKDDIEEQIFSALQDAPDFVQRQQGLISQPKPVINIIDDGESWQEKIKKTGYDPRKDPIIIPFITKLVEEGIEIPGMKGIEVIDDFI
ncbi:2099_t:CDS:1 [Scutellospora calospora]|uniref:2099_t:CDS:1 n=1 Tax=Scutellospora calospora TaxID=85575 RepID=A0ACA9MSK6_9GLOM|nr:2099_t:CDS:1 [Scutellospora calospora]